MTSPTGEKTSPTGEFYLPYRGVLPPLPGKKNRWRPHKNLTLGLPPSP